MYKYNHLKNNHRHKKDIRFHLDNFYKGWHIRYINMMIGLHRLKLDILTHNFFNNCNNLKNIQKHKKHLVNNKVIDNLYNLFMLYIAHNFRLDKYKKLSKFRIFRYKNQFALQFWFHRYLTMFQIRLIFVRIHIDKKNMRHQLNFK